jgi:hypothetical protein
MRLSCAAPGSTRTVAVLNLCEALSFLAEVKKLEPKKVSPKEARVFLRGMTKDDMSKYKTQRSMLIATLGTGDMLYLPSGALFAEQCKQENFGMKLTMLPNDPSASSALSELVGSLKKHGGVGVQQDITDLEACVHALVMPRLLVSDFTLTIQSTCAAELHCLVFPLLSFYTKHVAD